MRFASIYQFEKDKFQWDRDILELVFEKYTFGLFLLPLLFSISILFTFYLDIYRNNIYDNLIKSFLFFISILYLIFFKFINRSKFDWHLLWMTTILLGVIELIIDNTENKFTDPSNWIIIPILMLYHSFFSKNIPKLFSLYWFFIFTYFYIRLFLIHESFLLLYNLNGMFLYILPFYIFTSGFNFLLLRNRYTNILYLKNLEIETNKRIEIERELATQKATNLMVNEIHEQIGSAIQGFKVTLHEVISGTHFKSDIINEIYSTIYRAEDALTINIYSLSDMNFLQDDFFIGMKNILDKRYKVFRRTANILSSSLNSNDFLDLKDLKTLRQIFLICREICSNDLKYGSGTSEWKWYYENGLYLEFKSQTHFQEKKIGKGTTSIQNRVSFLKGNMYYKIENNLYYCKIFFPFPFNLYGVHGS